MSIGPFVFRNIKMGVLSEGENTVPEITLV